MFDSNICAGDRHASSDFLLESLKNGRKSVFFCNVHMLMLAGEDTGLAAAMASADIVFADGVPVAWLQRRVGVADAGVFRGYEAVKLLCSKSISEKKQVGFLGSTKHVLTELTNQLERDYAGLQIGYAHDPGMIENDPRLSHALVEQINAAGLEFLFVGLGCPKQEKWVSLHAPYLNCSLLAVGAAFDWLAGTITKPPGWMENAGLGWFYRLVQNPKIMWRRYLVFNTQFVTKSVKLLTWDRFIAKAKGLRAK